MVKRMKETNKCCTLTTALVIATVLRLSTSSSVNGDGVHNEAGDVYKDFYSFEALDINNVKMSLEKFRGKVSLVVNVASECGYTDDHYRELNVLQEAFSNTGLFTVLAFPCNQFGQQEPGTSKEIQDFAYKRKGANFPLFAKINVVKSNVHPAWSYLISSSGQAPTWNFWKYLVDHNGHVINAWGPHTRPDELYDTIKSALENIPQKTQEENHSSRGDEF